MSISDFKHIYFGSLYCGPCEAFFRLKHKNLLLPRDVRKVSVRNKIAARRFDLTWRKNVRKHLDDLLSTFEDYSKNKMSEENDPLEYGYAIASNYMLENIYPFIGAHALLASANNREVSEEADIKKLLDIAELIVEGSCNGDLRNEQRKRFDRIRKSIEACRSFGFYCAMARIFGKNDEGGDNVNPIWVLTSSWDDLVDDLIFTLTTEEQRHIYSILGFSDEDVAFKYLRKASDLTNQYPAELMESGILDSREQFADFVTKGKAFGIFSGWDDSTNTPSRRDVCLNEHNPIVAQILADKKKPDEPASELPA